LEGPPQNTDATHTRFVASGLPIPERTRTGQRPPGPPKRLFQLGADRYYARDYKNALEFFLRAAETGCASAQYAVGFILYQHTARNAFTLYKQHKNDNAAFDWFTKAAEQGHAKAQYMLGIFNQYAYCTPYNEREANKWFHLAAAQGHTAARQRLSRMNILHKVRAIPLTKWVMEPPPAAPLPD
jgi:TPR repeat protein